MKPTSASALSPDPAILAPLEKGTLEHRAFVESLAGKYKDCFSSSEEFARRKQDEIEREGRVG